MNKYRNKICTGLKHTFRSKSELGHAFYLEHKKQNGRIRSWEYEKNFDLEVNGKLVCRHSPDFLVTLPDGSQEIHEIKSPVTKTDGWRIKKKLTEILFPHIPYRVIMTSKSWR